MENGFIYLVFRFVLEKLRFLTLVEWFKRIGHLFCGKNKDKAARQVSDRVAVDVYIVLKWAFVFVILLSSFTNNVVTAIVWYLLFANIYSYFYHHIWSDEAIKLQHMDIDRARRRFINLLLALGFSDLCFAYLYRLPYGLDYNWSGSITNTKAIWFSISNSFAANYETVAPISDIGNSVAMTQLVITFIFVTIIISKSIPQYSKD